MFSFGAKSLEHLKQVHPKLVNCVLEAIQDSSQDFSVFEGVRSLQKERENIASGASHLKNAADCKHCIQSSGYGHAVDLVPFVDNQNTWDWEYVWPIAAAMQIAQSRRGIKIRWGAVWDRTMDQLGDDLHKEVEDYKERRKKLGKKAFLDGVHFEIILGV